MADPFHFLHIARFEGDKEDPDRRKKRFAEIEDEAKIYRKKYPFKVRKRKHHKL